MRENSKNVNLIISNGVYLSIRLIFVLIASFYITRLSLTILGDVDYGINNIVGGVTVIFSIITMPLITTIQRFFNVEFALNRHNDAVVFNTSKRLVYAIIIIIFILYETIGLYLITKVINIPEERKFAALILYQITAFTNIFTFLYIPYQVLLISKENMGVLAYTEVGLSLFRIIFLLIIPYIKIDLLISYSMILLVGHFFVLIYYYLYCKKKYSKVVDKKPFNNDLFKEMIKFSGWSSVESISGIALNYGSNIILNVYGGVLYNTAYGISKQISNAILSFTTNVLRVFDPQITTSYARMDNSYRDKLVLFSLKISFLLIGYVFVVFSIDGEIILKLWLTRIPKHAFEFTSITVLIACFSSIILPIRTLIIASGKIKEYFIGYAIITFTSIILMLLLLEYSLPMITIMYILLSHSFVMLIFAMTILKKKISFPVFKIIKDLFKAFVVLVIISVVYLFINIQFANNFLSLLLKITFSSIFLIIFSYLLVLNKSEKKQMHIILKKITNRI